MKYNDFLLEKRDGMWFLDTLRKLPKRQRKTFGTKQEAVDYADSLRKKIEEYGVKSVLSPHQQADALTALKVLADANCSSTLTSAAEFFAKHNGIVTKTVYEVYEELNAEKQASKLSTEYKRKFGTGFKQFVEEFGDVPVGKVTHLDIDHFLKSVKGIEDPDSPLSDDSIHERFRSIRMLFRHAIYKRYMTINPLTFLKAPPMPKHHPQILTIDQARSLVETAMTAEFIEFLPLVVFGLFCGARPAEILRLKWRDVKLDENSVSLTYMITKKANTRNVPIPLNANLLLDIFTDRRLSEHDMDKHVLDLTRKGNTRSDARTDGAVNFSQRFKAFTKAAGFKSWPANACRHSYASYLLKVSGDDRSLVQDRMGHSKVSTTFNHYIASTPSRQNCLDYWLIGGKIVKQNTDLSKWRNGAGNITNWTEVLKYLNLTR